MLPTMPGTTRAAARPDTPWPAARQQLHHALQFATAVGLSFLETAADDSHTNLGWSPALAALASREVSGPNGPVQVALRVRDLTLLVMVDGHVTSEVPLHGRTIPQATSVLQEALAGSGLAGARFTLRRHYVIPTHPVATGTPFDAVTHAPAFGALADWLDLSAGILEEVASALGGSEVRLWPHHADIATLVRLPGGRSTGAGLAIGDAYYEEPYYYVNAYPAPIRAAITSRPLAGSGHWHLRGWTGAVLPVSRVTAAEQRTQVEAFLSSALDVTTRL